MSADPIQNFMNQRASVDGRQSLLQRMSASETIDVTVRAYQVLARLFLARTVVPALYCTTALLFLIQWASGIFETKATDHVHQFSEMAFKVGVLVVVALPLFMIGLSWIEAIVTGLTADWMRGTVPDGNAVAKRTLSVFPRLLWAGVREAVLSFSGFIVAAILLFISAMLPDTAVQSGELLSGIGVLGLILGGFVVIIVRCIHCLVTPIVYSEGLKASVAAKRSRILLSAADAWSKETGYGAVGRLAGVLVIGLIALFSAWGMMDQILGVTGAIENFLPGTILHTVLTDAWQIVPLFLLVWLLAPVWSMGVTVTYFGCRVRMEGYDIDLLASETWNQNRKARFEV